MINEGLYPPAPDLGAKPTQALADGELLNIIKNGIRFTGMPGWGGTDDENWSLVLFIRHLPKLTEDSFPGVLSNVIAGRIVRRNQRWQRPVLLQFLPAWYAVKPNVAKRMTPTTLNMKPTFQWQRRR